MNLNEEIRRNRKLMGLKEQKTIYNLDLIEGWTDDISNDMKWYEQEVQKIKDKYPDDMDAQWDKLQIVRDEIKRRDQERNDKWRDDVNRKKDIKPAKANPIIDHLVWRAGELKLNPKAGGIWFAESKEDVEKFAMSVRKEKREGKPYYINIENPYHFDSFWNGYIEAVENIDFITGREKLMMELMKKGYDGIVVDTDTWNDTADDNSVNSKQYVVFNSENVKPA